MNHFRFDWTVLLLLSLSTPKAAGAAVSAEEVGGCKPPCRSGYTCLEGKCVSLCNPPCARWERCVSGECEPVPPREPSEKSRYLGVLGVFHARLTSSALHMGEIRLEFGGKYSTLQVGPAFGKNLTSLRTAILGHVPFRVTAAYPFYLVPTISLGYSFGWLNDGRSSHLQDIFLVPGLRLRYDIIPRMAIALDLIQVQVSFLRLRSSPTEDIYRLDEVPVTWNFGLGLAFLY